MKKLLFIFVLSIIVSVFASCSIYKKEEEQLSYSQGLVFELSEDQQSYILVGIGECTDNEIIIPSTYNGLPVTCIGDYAFEGCESIRMVVIPDSVIIIDGWAFSSCRSLESVEIPNSVISIGMWAFAGCTSLTSIVFPNSITCIDPCLFYGCSALANVNIPDSITNISGKAFAGCSALKSIIISDCVTVIETSAFMGCNALTIYCEAETKPDGWDSNWNPSNCPVVWGYKPE